MQTTPPRRPGELVFNVAVFATSLFLLWTAYGISGFAGMSSPGAIPMAATAIMVLTSGLALAGTLRKPSLTGERIERDILPVVVVATIGLIGAYAVALTRLGFLPTSFVFLTLAIRLYSRRGLGWCVAVALVSVALVWVVFRLVFSVLMPPGLVPEGEILAVVRGLLAGGR